MLGRLNIELREDEQAAAEMSEDTVIDRMRGWLAGDYDGFLFAMDGDVVAYALSIQSTDECRPGRHCVYLRQFFVTRRWRRQGIGRDAFAIWRSECVNPEVPIEIDVLVHNRAGRAFWDSVGFTPRYTRMRIEPDHLPTDA